MKTLKQWYDSLSEPAQEWIVKNCSAWFDKNQADYYRKPSAVSDNAKDLQEFLAHGNTFEKYSDSDNFKSSTARYLSLLKYLNQTCPDVIPNNLVNLCAYQLIKATQAQTDAWLYVDADNKDTAFKCTFQRYDKMAFRHYLYLIKDYDKMEFDWKQCEIPSLTKEVIEIIGWDNAVNVAKQSDMHSLSLMISYGKPNELFDQLFFCKDSHLNQSEKLNLLSRLYNNNSHLPSEETTADFFKRIVAVDHSYLRYIFSIIQRYPALAMKLYSEKKPESELTGNESSSEQYRYNKEIRKLFVIAHMCALKRVSKVKSGIVKEVAPLLKIYGYNWTDIYDAMYPEDAHLN